MTMKHTWWLHAVFICPPSYFRSNDLYAVWHLRIPDSLRPGALTHGVPSWSLLVNTLCSRAADRGELETVLILASIKVSRLFLNHQSKRNSLPSKKTPQIIRNIFFFPIFTLDQILNSFITSASRWKKEKLICMWMCAVVCLWVLRSSVTQLLNQIFCWNPNLCCKVLLVATGKQQRNTTHGVESQRIRAQQAEEKPQCCFPSLFL